MRVRSGCWTMPRESKRESTSRKHSQMVFTENVRHNFLVRDFRDASAKVAPIDVSDWNAFEYAEGLMRALETDLAFVRGVAAHWQEVVEKEAGGSPERLAAKKALKPWRVWNEWTFPGYYATICNRMKVAPDTPYPDPAPRSVADERDLDLDRWLRIRLAMFEDGRREVATTLWHYAGLPAGPLRDESQVKPYGYGLIHIHTDHIRSIQGSQSKYGTPNQH